MKSLFLLSIFVFVFSSAQAEIVESEDEATLHKIVGLDVVASGYYYKSDYDSNLGPVGEELSVNYRGWTYNQRINSHSIYYHTYCANKMYLMVSDVLYTHPRFVNLLNLNKINLQELFSFKQRLDKLTSKVSLVGDGELVIQYGVYRADVVLGEPLSNHCRIMSSKKLIEALNEIAANY
ncbi:MAG: hypothetical protein ACPGJV_08375 [Bacteriovoracaceae bacterium]